MLSCWLPASRVVIAVAAMVLAACSHHAPVPDASGNPPEFNSADWDTSWHHRQLPGKKPTEYTLSKVDGRVAMNARSNSAASLLRQQVRVESSALDRIGFSWKVPELIAQADLANRDLSDSPVRIVLAFEGDRSKLSMKNSLLSQMAHSLTGEPMPYATLMYVWSNTLDLDSIVASHRTDRIQKIVVESGPMRLNQWATYERNIRADFERAFGEPPGTLVGIGIMTDTDNTRGRAQAWYGPVKLVNRH